MRAKIHHGNAGKRIESLLKTYEFECPMDYYQYIIDSYVNGHKDQVIELFNEMMEYDQKTFLLNVERMASIYGEKVHDLIIKSL